MGVNLRGVAAGTLALMAAQLLSSGKGPAAGVAGLSWISTGVRRLIDPKVAGIPNRAKWVDPISAYNVDPNTGVPNQDPSKPLLRDEQGRPF